MTSHRGLSGRRLWARDIGARTFGTRHHRSGAVDEFTPADLFGPGDVGAFYDPSVLSSVWQDSGRTTPGAVDSPVGALDDLSGNGNNILQATGASRPQLRQSGSLYYLEFDGVDDRLGPVLFTITQPWSAVGAARQVTWTAGNVICGGGNSTSGSFYQSSVTPQVRLFDGSNGDVNTDLAVGQTGVATERHSNATSRLAINNNAYVFGTTGTGVPGGLTIGGAFNGTASSDIWFFGRVEIDRDLTDSEIAQTRQYFAAKGGVTL